MTVKTDRSLEKKNKTIIGVDYLISSLLLVGRAFEYRRRRSAENQFARKEMLRRWW